MRAGGHAGYEIAPFIPSLAAAAALLHACATRCLHTVSGQGSHDSTTHVSRGQAGACGARADWQREGGSSSCRGPAPSPSMEPCMRAGMEGSCEGRGVLGLAGAQGRDSCCNGAASPSPSSKPCREGRAAAGGDGEYQPCAALNTVRHHDMHHRFPTRHFSLYFTHWDRWCGTEHPAYRAQARSRNPDLISNLSGLMKLLCISSVRGGCLKQSQRAHYTGTVCRYVLCRCCLEAVTWDLLVQPMCGSAVCSLITVSCSRHGDQPVAVSSQGGGALPGACGCAEKCGEPRGMQRRGRRTAQQQPRAVPASCRSMMRTCASSVAGDPLQQESHLGTAAGEHGPTTCGIGMLGGLDPCASTQHLLAQQNKTILRVRQELCVSA